MRTVRKRLPSAGYESKALISEMHVSDYPSIEKIRITVSPESIYSHFKALPYSFFLDSALSSSKLSRFSFIGIEPFLVFKSKKDCITLDWIKRRETKRGNPFLILKKLFKEFALERNADFPVPFTGGGVGYFSYDLKDFNEPRPFDEMLTYNDISPKGRGSCLPDKAIDELNIPDCVISFYDSILAFDHLRNEAFVISTGFPEKGKRRLYRKKARLESLKNRVYALRAQDDIYFPSGNTGLSPKLESNFTKDSYVKTIEKAKEYIKAGDIYQVNLAQRFKVKLSTEPFDLYRILRMINPAPFASFLNFGDIKIVSASPERFIKKEARFVETRPVKGTRPRGKNPTEDANLKKELMASIKDKAENLMIIDLERNDLGRICEYGSVRVSEFMTCEEYATVFHLVSTVEGRLREKIDPIDCLINCFPGGSITGAPKIRSMEIIEELEPVKRSVYTGSIGYIGFDGNMDTSVVIRTFIIKGKNAYFHVGGGIVYDSDPEKEFQETLDKAKALIEAIYYESSLLKQKIHSA